MSGFGRGLASLGAIAGGLVQGERMLRDDARIKEQDGMRKQEFDAKMGDVNRANQTRISLADAYRPRTAADGVVTDGQKGNEDVAINPVDTVALNSPEAQNTRAAQVLRQAGDPAAALNLENATIKSGQLKTEADAQKVEAARKAFNVGMVSSFRTGGPDALMKFLSDSHADGNEGKVKLQHEIGPDGAVQVFADKDGQRTPLGPKFANDENGWSSAMFTLQRGLSPNDLLAHQSAVAKAGIDERKVKVSEKNADTNLDYKSGLIDAKEAALEAKKAAAGATGQPTREERLRYTSLFSDAGRRLSEAQKALVTLQRDPMFSRAAAKPGTPQSQQVQDLQEAIKSHKEERTLYQGLLSGSQSTPSLSNATTPAAPTSAKPGGATPWIPPAAQNDQRSILESELAKSQEAAAKGDARAAADVAGLQRELGRLPAKPGLSSAKPSGKPDFSSLWK